MKRYVPFRLKGVSLLFEKKAMAVIGILILILIGVLVLSISAGDVMINPIEVVNGIFGTGSEMTNLIVRSFRMPRTLLAGLAGIGLAVAGAILQGLVRNPLASPDIIGVTGGASVTTVAFLAAFSTNDHSLTVSVQWVPLASFIGALAMIFIVFILSNKNGMSRMRLVLIGIGLASGAQAITNFLLVMGSAYLATKANIWITGSVYGATWQQVTILSIWSLIFLILSLVLARRMNVQELGENIAASVGSHVKRDRNILLALCAALTGGAVAFAGGIGFVGLMAPHMARRLVGTSFGSLIPASALLGGIIVILADTAGRTLFLPLQVPVGVFTAAIGAPYFIYLLYISRKAKR
ncbi:FecCD family ABC transporter permease [Tuberibacillus sp. Marseille-P3662]|uniref:FecCD family ABC transporter permease n=1 Tax=Tuberibacillus sp. Marseille-P3662 TaxID=1965358 RepID=UPI000A1CBF31|nr:iron ABC transporter permease [Tuberibacillus sp. Marseille-P3662]